MTKFFSNSLYNPTTLLRIDALGATLSAILLGIVLPPWSDQLGVPNSTLYFLAAWPVLFALYDFVSYRRAAPHHASCLRNIALANLGYCLLSAAFLSYHRETLTAWGWAYFIGEILIVGALVVWELRVAVTGREMV